MKNGEFRKVDYLLPIIFTTVCAKWVGDKLNDGIYHTMHHVKGIPYVLLEFLRLFVLNCFELFDFMINLISGFWKTSRQKA